MKTYALFKVGQFWHYRFRLDGKRSQRSTGESVRRKADLVAQEAFEAAVLRARGEEPCPTVSGLVALWLAAQPGTTSSAYLKAVETFGRLHLYGMADMRLSEVRTSHVEEARKLHLETHAPASGNHWLNNLKMLFNWAIERRMLKVREWRVKLLRFQKKPRVILSPSLWVPYLKAVDQVATPAMRIVIRLAMGLGLREMECAGACWEWIDWEAKIYRPGKTKGKEAKPRPMPDWLVNYLRPLAKKSGWIAPTLENEPFSAGYMRKVMAKANLLAGIPKLTPHRLRGSYCTMLLAMGIAPPDVQEVMGHKDIRTTLSYYEKDVERVRAGMNELAARAGMPGRGIGATSRAKRAAERET